MSCLYTSFKGSPPEEEKSLQSSVNAIVDNILKNSEEIGNTLDPILVVQNLVILANLAILVNLVILVITLISCACCYENLWIFFLDFWKKV